MPGIETPRGETRADRVSFSEENLAELTGQWRSFAVADMKPSTLFCRQPTESVLAGNGSPSPTTKRKHFDNAGRLNMETAR